MYEAVHLALLAAVTVSVWWLRRRPLFVVLALLVLPLAPALVNIYFAPIPVDPVVAYDLGGDQPGCTPAAAPNGTAAAPPAPACNDVDVSAASLQLGLLVVAINYATVLLGVACGWLSRKAMVTR